MYLYSSIFFFILKIKPHPNETTGLFKDSYYMERNEHEKPLISENCRVKSRQEGIFNHRSILLPKQNMNIEHYKEPEFKKKTQSFESSLVKEENKPKIILFRPYSTSNYIGRTAPKSELSQFKEHKDKDHLVCNASLPIRNMNAPSKSFQDQNNNQNVFTHDSVSNTQFKYLQEPEQSQDNNTVQELVKYNGITYYHDSKPRILLNNTIQSLNESTNNDFSLFGFKPTVGKQNNDLKSDENHCLKKHEMDQIIHEIDESLVNQGNTTLIDVTEASSNKSLLCDVETKDYKSTYSSLNSLNNENIYLYQNERPPLYPSNQYIFDNIITKPTHPQPIVINNIYQSLHFSVFFQLNDLLYKNICVQIKDFMQNNMEYHPIETMQWKYGEITNESYAQILNNSLNLFFNKYVSDRSDFIGSFDMENARILIEVAERKANEIYEK